MKLAVFLKAVLFVVLVNYSAAAQEVLKVEVDSIPVLEEWWRTEISPSQWGGISFLPNFKDGHGAIAITTGEGDKTWMLLFPGDTQNVFTWPNGAAFNIQTGDFNGDGIQDYLDRFGNIFPGIQNSQLPSIETQYYASAGQTSGVRLITDCNNDGFDDVINGSYLENKNILKVLLGNKDFTKLHTIEIIKPKLSEFYDESVVGIYHDSDKTWRMVCYWDDYSLMMHSSQKKGNAGFVLYKLIFTSKNDSTEIQAIEINRTTEKSKDYNLAYYPSTTYI
jgi:hypothetical protein